MHNSPVDILLKKQCELNNTHLLEVESEIENTWAVEAFLPPPKQGLCPVLCSCSSWIGATDIDKEGDFTWNKKTEVTYSNWQPGKPSNDRNSDCVQLCPNGLWDDAKCVGANNLFAKKSEKQCLFGKEFLSSVCFF
ncbi:perlucin-like protein [Saccostrea cucullata]|uniref:perlucin-like protein n=1 Tax=Saccostrea cuccullata TaxID=36930 RepID=UPI002ECFE1D9